MQQIQNLTNVTVEFSASVYKLPRAKGILDRLVNPLLVQLESRSQGRTYSNSSILMRASFAWLLRQGRESSEPVLLIPEPPQVRGQEQVLKPSRHLAWLVFAAKVESPPG